MAEACERTQPKELVTGLHLSVVKNQHIRLGHPWSNALDLELREGKRACERGIGLPQKCGAPDIQKLADLAVGVDPLRSGGPMFSREGALCGSWWAMREVELSTDACKSSSSKVKGGRCVFNLLWEETHARLRMFSLRWWRQVLVPGQGGQEVVLWCRSPWTSWCSPDSSDEADVSSSQKCAATLTFQKLAALTGTVTGSLGTRAELLGHKSWRWREWTSG